MIKSTNYKVLLIENCRKCNYSDPKWLLEKEGEGQAGGIRKCSVIF